MNRWAPLLVLSAAMLWATDAPFRVHLTRSLPVGFIVLVEHLVACLLLLPWLWSRRAEILSLDRRQWLAVVLIGVGGSALSTLAFTASFAFVSPSVAILLQKLQPLVAITFSAVLLHERITRWFAWYAILALLGGYLISFPGLYPEVVFFGGASGTLKGVALALAATALWGTSTVLGKYLLRSTSFQTVTVLRFLTAFVVLLAWVPLTGSGVGLASVAIVDWVFLAIIAITSGVVSLILYYRGLRHCPASVATLAELGFPIAAVVINRVFLNEQLVVVQLGGMFLILFAMWGIGRRPPGAAVA